MFQHIVFIIYLYSVYYVDPKTTGTIGGTLITFHFFNTLQKENKVKQEYLCMLPVVELRLSLLPQSKRIHSRKSIVFVSRADTGIELKSNLQVLSRVDIFLVLLLYDK